MSSGGYSVEHLTGTLFRVHPGAQAHALAPGASLQIPLVHGEQLVSSTKAPVGPYLVFDATPDVAHSLLPVDSLPPVFPTPQDYQRRSGTLHWQAMPTIVAAPQLRAEASQARAMLATYLRPNGAPATPNPAVLRLAVARLAGEDSPEAYQLVIDPAEGVSIAGNSAAGVARGLASLRALLPPRAGQADTLSLPALSISDAPRFAYRGLMLDVARNFQPRSSVLRVLDLMARFKLNVLHLHLCDDEGWRLEIPGLPELTAVGARRGHSSDPLRQLPPAYGSGPDSADPYGTGYYRRADYLQILRYAAALHIEVIPELEMPGHARAAVISMANRSRRLAPAGAALAASFQLHDPDDKSVYSSAQLYTDNVMNPALPSTYAFIEHVVSALVALHREAGVPLHTLHMGADELPEGSWDGSPACQALMKREHIKDKAGLWNYFYSRVDGILKRHGLSASGWEELGARRETLGAESRLAPNPAFLGRGVTLYVWRNIEGSEDLAYRLANAGYDVVLAPATRLYFDMASYPNPDEPGQDWAAFADLDSVFDYVPCDDVRASADDPTAVRGKEHLTESGRKHIRGIEGTLFTETVRGDERMEFMLVPRLLWPQSDALLL